MSAFFGKRKTKGEKTVALVDIESGSVASALVRLSEHEAPKLFAEIRISIPLFSTRNSDQLAHLITQATEQALEHTSSVASRMRNHGALGSQGEVDRVAIFFSAPWASLHLEGGTADFIKPVEAAAYQTAGSVFGDIPTTFHPLGTAALHGAMILLPSNTPSLLLIVGGEVSELLVRTDRELLGRATIPAGQRTLLRTLISHGGVSPAEAESFLELATREKHPLYEPMRAAEDHLTSLVTEATKDLQGQNELSGIMVVAQEPFSEIVAKALSRREDLAESFLEGGTVRSMKTPHITPYIAAHAHKPDLSLLLEALFIDRKFAPR
ncbi:MAG: hypothetical protein G01um101456_406 [Parcubacteria group bacterium Gr01-1014_56]|nr:MAG: hypothetical protein G01um101456_406 [Parcubacteria group bacterium Gr01-1014_56]